MVFRFFQHTYGCCNRDVNRGVVVCMGRVAALPALKLVLTLTVGFLAMPALTTGAGRVARIDGNHRDSRELRLVLDERPQLKERPSAHFCSLALSKPCPRPNALEGSRTGSLAAWRVFPGIGPLDLIAVGAEALISALTSVIDNGAVKTPLVVVSFPGNCTITGDVVYLKGAYVGVIAAVNTAPTERRDCLCLQLSPTTSVAFSVLFEVFVPVSPLASKASGVVSGWVFLSFGTRLLKETLTILAVVNLMSAEMLLCHDPILCDCPFAFNSNTAIFNYSQNPSQAQ